MPEEQLPDEAPLPLFFLPNFLGILLAIGLEHLNLETLLRTTHPYGLLGLGIFCLFGVNTYLAGSVVIARVEYGVKLPHLYATGRTKNAIMFNCIQRGHQNFLEQLPQIALVVFFLTLIGRPNTAGMLLLVVSVSRVGYAIGYKSSDVRNRLPAIILSQFSVAVGIGYSALVGLTMLGIYLMNDAFV